MYFISFSNHETIIIIIIIFVIQTVFNSWWTRDFQRLRGSTSIWPVVFQRVCKVGHSLCFFFFWEGELQCTSQIDWLISAKMQMVRTLCQKSSKLCPCLADTAVCFGDDFVFYYIITSSPVVGVANDAWAWIKTWEHCPLAHYYHRRCHLNWDLAFSLVARSTLCHCAHEMMQVTVIAAFSKAKAISHLIVHQQYALAFHCHQKQLFAFGHQHQSHQSRRVVLSLKWCMQQRSCNKL